LRVANSTHPVTPASSYRAAMNRLVAFTSGGAPTLDLELTWRNGTDPGEPPAQVHNLDEHTVVVRQSLRTSPEGPFVVLLFGNERAFLLDTGHAGDRSVWPLRRIVDDLINGWLTSHPRENYDLVVAHSHAHNDHTAGDEQFADRPNTQIVGAEVDEVREFFGLRDWPLDPATFDLGGRRLKVIPSPGHHESAISVLDPYTGFLLSGDTVYPGRLYVPDMRAFLSTLSRLTELADSGHVTHVLGSHIEFDREGRDYPLGAREHPDEESPFMPPDVLVAVRDAALRVADSPGVHSSERFAIYNGNRIRDRLRLVARSLWTRLRAG